MVKTFLQMELTLAKKSLNNTDDTDFVELMRLKNGITQYVARPTEYSVLGENIARRTFDLQGDVTIRDFSVDIRESLNDGTNNGVYTQAQTTDDNNTPSDDLLTVQVSPGKAYVRGYEIDVIVPSFLDLEKPRQFRTVDSAITPVEVGNYALIENAYNIPDLSPSITGEVEEPYRTIELFDTRTSSRGSASGTRIGFARARAIEHNSGNDGSSDKFLASSTATDSDFKLYLFDIRMFTQLTLSGTPDPVIATGSRVRGSTSGAIGYATSDTTGTSLFLTSVVGTFSAGETLICTSSTEADELLQDSGSTDLTISSIDTFAFENAKQVFMDDPDAGQDFTADLKLESEFSLNGFASIDAGDLDAVIGSGSAFSSELRVCSQRVC